MTFEKSVGYIYQIFPFYKQVFRHIRISVHLAQLVKLECPRKQVIYSLKDYLTPQTQQSKKKLIKQNKVTHTFTHLSKK